MGGLQKTALGMQWVMCPCISPSFALSLCQLLWVSITPQSNWMFRKDYYNQTVKRRLLMSPVFNHHTVEWFYAYFICISLNRVSVGHSEPGKVQCCGGRDRKVPLMPIFKSQGLSMCAMLPTAPRF
uniref:Uncharacterized protein n=2 Tax=Gopherus TaxID=38771 RepID=A0A8C4WT92_9SAUR